MNFDPPPSAFSNKINDLSPDFDFSNWRESGEWKMFVAGYNEAVRVANDKIRAQYNMGETVEKLFKGNKP